MRQDEQKSLSSTIFGLGVGEQSVFPLSKLFSVRTLACNIGTVNGRRYQTKTDREAGRVYVTRIA